MAYKGMMLTELPNMAFTIGYTNASWTLKADLVSEFVCRVINHMDANGYDTVVPQHPGDSVEARPLMDFTPGYILRALDRLPKAGAKVPWRLKQNYLLDIGLIRHGRVDDPALRFSRRRAPSLPRRRDDDDSVVVAVGEFAGHEGDSAELDLDVTFSGTGLAALARVGAQRLDARCRSRAAPRRRGSRR